MLTIPERIYAITPTLQCAQLKSGLLESFGAGRNTAITGFRYQEKEERIMNYERTSVTND